MINCKACGLEKQKRIYKASYNHGYYPILFENEKVAKRVQAALNAEEIYPRRYFYPSLNTLGFLSKGNAMPVSLDIASRILCLPLFTELSDEDCQRVCEIVLAALGEK